MNRSQIKLINIFIDVTISKLPVQQFLHRHVFFFSGRLGTRNTISETQIQSRALFYSYLNIYIKNEHTKEIIGVKEKPDIIERKGLQWHGHVKRMQKERLPKLIMEWIPGKRRKRGRPRKTWMEGVGAAMTTRHLEADQ